MVAAEAAIAGDARTRGTDRGEAVDLGGDRSLRHAVEAYILNQIRSGHLAPGSWVREMELATLLGVSLTPVREALFRLVHDGLIVHLPRRGFQLAELGPQQIEEISSFRMVLEGIAAAHAAQRILPEEIAALERLIDEGAGAARAGDLMGNAEANARFHTLIIQAARHSIVERAWRMIAPLRWLLGPAGVPPMSAEEIDDWVTRHRVLLDAIRSGDPAVAEAVARKHVEEGARVPRARAGLARQAHRDERT